MACKELFPLVNTRSGSSDAFYKELSDRAALRRSYAGTSCDVLSPLVQVDAGLNFRSPNEAN